MGVTWKKANERCHTIHLLMKANLDLFDDFAQLIKQKKKIELCNAKLPSGRTVIRYATGKPIKAEDLAELVIFWLQCRGMDMSAALQPGLTQYIATQIIGKAIEKQFGKAEKVVVKKKKEDTKGDS